jgi:hypothetical protein
MFYVYAHYRKTDDSIFYIGVAKSKKRFTSKYSRNKYWKNIVEKHGFYYKILMECDDWSECFKKEIELIKLYGRLDLKTGLLCNMTDGGEGCLNISVESKLKISEKLKGIKRSDEFKKAVRNRMIGTNLSYETRKKMSNAAKNKSKYNTNNLIPKKPLDDVIIDKINIMYQSKISIINICKELSITKPTLYKYLKNCKKRYKK